MRASTRRSLAVLSAATLALAACAEDDAGNGDDPAAAPEAEPGDPEDMPEDMPEEMPEGMEGMEEQEPPTFEEGELEDGEVVPGVMLDVPEGAETQAGPGPGGVAFQAFYTEEEASVFVEAAVQGLSIDDLLVGLEQVEQTGEAEISSEPEDIEVDGADDARTVTLIDANDRQATIVVATAGEAAVSATVENQEGSEFDADPILDTLSLDGDRIVEGTPEAPEQPLG